MLDVLILLVYYYLIFPQSLVQLIISQDMKQ